MPAFRKNKDDFFTDTSQFFFYVSIIFYYLLRPRQKWLRVASCGPPTIRHTFVCTAGNELAHTTSSYMAAAGFALEDTFKCNTSLRREREVSSGCGPRDGRSNVGARARATHTSHSWGETFPPPITSYHAKFCFHHVLLTQNASARTPRPARSLWPRAAHRRYNVYVLGAALSKGLVRTHLADIIHN